MPDQPKSNVKIYERPEPKVPAPLLMVVALVVVLVGGYFLYKTFYHPVTEPTNKPVGILLPVSACWPVQDIL